MLSVDFPRGSQHPATLLLTGGASARSGGEPKAVREYRGVPVVLGMARLALALEAEPVVAIAGSHAPEIARALAREPNVRCVEHPGWSAGRTGTIQAGLAELHGPPAVLLWPVDHPFVRAESLRRLIGAAASDPMAAFLLPTYAGQGGHPVLLRGPALSGLTNLGPDEPLRTLIPRLGPQVRRVPVSDPGVVENLDDGPAFRRASDRVDGEGGAPWTVD